MFFLPAEFSVAGIAKRDVPLIFVSVVLAFSIFYYIWIELTYINFTYELRDADIVIREGVFTRKTTVIPYVTIQDINSERTILERILGLATLEIETAGSSRIASETFIPGISNKDELIAEIMRRVQLAKGESHQSSNSKLQTTEALLEAILQELKILSSKIDKLGIKDSKRSAFEDYEAFKKRR
ncbi:MAG: PH domain-containing protein [Candidatus Anstonellaceae archaeon]